MNIAKQNYTADQFYNKLGMIQENPPSQDNHNSVTASQITIEHTTGGSQVTDSQATSSQATGSQTIESSLSLFQCWYEFYLGALVAVISCSVIIIFTLSTTTILQFVRLRNLQ